MFTKSSFLVLLTVALSATSALAASDVGSKGAVSRRHHTPSKLSRSVAPSIKFSAKRSLKKKQEAKLARGLKAVNARGTNKLSRRDRITAEEDIGDEGRTGDGSRVETGEEEDEDNTFNKPTSDEEIGTKGKSGDEDTFNNRTGDDEGTFDDSRSKTVEVDDEGYVPKGESANTEDKVVTSGRFEGEETGDRDSDRIVDDSESDFGSDDDEDEEGFGSDYDEEDLETTRLNNDKEVSGGGRESNGRVTQDEEESNGRVTQDEDAVRVTGNKDETDRISTTEDEDGGRGSDRGSRITRADDSDFDKIARAEGIRRAPSGRWLGRRFK